MKTNKLILGTVQFGLNYGINNTSGKPSQDEVNSILTVAYQSGIRCLDTAEAYGNAHEVIGTYHLQHPEHRFDVITKLPHQIDAKLINIEKYLQQLHVSQLESLLFHSYESYQQHIEIIPKLKSYKLEGKIKYIGVSTYTNAQIAEVINDDDIDIIQHPFNLFDNLSQRGEILIQAKKRGKIIHTRSAFLQGLFFTAPTATSKIVNSLQKELSLIRELANDYGISIQKLALNYCLQQKLIDNVLIGIDNVSQLLQNIDDTDFMLSEDIMQEVDRIAIKNGDLLNPSLWN